MCYSPVRIEAWLADLAAINRELDAAGYRAPCPAARRRRRFRPLWEE